MRRAVQLLRSEYVSDCVLETAVAVITCKVCALLPTRTFSCPFFDCGWRGIETATLTSPFYDRRNVPSKKKVDTFAFCLNNFFITPL